jgi:hypothetical protein
MSKTEQLKQAYLESDKQYQYAVASGDGAQMLDAIKKRNAAFEALNKAKRREFNKTYKYQVGA